MTRTPIVRTELVKDWTVRAAAGPSRIEQTVPATVPGVVHLDLLAAGLIPDPYLDDNESALAWIGLVDWTYETTLSVSREELDAAERHELAFDGLDTVATVSLNGTVVAEVANQHRTHRCDVTALLRPGDNELVVAFRSPIKHANAQSLALGARPRPYPLPYDAIRKSACSFGWDWGIATYASGIWRPVRLESWSVGRLAGARVEALPEGAGGVVRVVPDVARTGTGSAEPLAVRVTVRTHPKSTTSAEVVRLWESSDGEAGAIELRLDEVDLWWPVGYGEQPLSDVLVELLHGEQVIDSLSRRVGFRTVAWDTEPDAAGTPFQLVVNDVPIFVKGVNWIPDDAFPSRIGPDRYRRRLEQAAAANLNLIRVWGGGIYESDDFYDLCDELGLLSWQDFAFACAAYSEEEPLRSEVEAEARDNVARLAHHASLVLFTGNNENLWGYEDWGWQQVLDGASWGAHYYYELLPAVVAELAPHVPYVPGSPFSPDGSHPNAEAHGTMHLWEQWNSLDWPTYREVTPRFVAEFGWQGPPTWSTLTASISDDPLTPESPGMLVHQKALDGNGKLTRGLIGHYRVPADMETWHWAMQLNQANAVGCALDWFRAHAPLTSGAVVWQLNDCWPVTSWAAIDGYGREKPLLQAIRNAFAPRVITVHPTESGLFAAVTNDTGEALSAELKVRRLSFDGSVLAESTQPIEVDARGTLRVDLDADVVTAGDPSRELVVAECAPVDSTALRGFWFFAEPRDSALPAADLDVAVEPQGDAFAVTVTARSLVRDLTLLVDKLEPDATVDSGLVTLLPGESHVFVVRGADSIAAQAVSRPEVLRSGNQLVGPAS